MLASAVAGRRIEVVAGRPDEPAWSDGHTIVVDPTQGEQRAVEAVVVHAALIGAGSLARDILRPLVWRSRLRRRFLSIEGPRAVAGLRGLLPRSLTYMICDDAAALSDSPASSLALARTHAPIPEFGLYLGTLRPREILSAQHRDSVTTEGPDEPLAVGSDVERSATDDKPTQPVPLNRMPDDSSLFAAGNGSTWIGRLLRAMMRGAGLTGEDGPIGGDHRPSASAVSRTGSTLSVGGSVADEPAMAHPDKPFRYPEWDSRIAGYRPNWCTVRVIEPDNHAGGSMTAAELGLRRPLSRLGTGAEICHRQPYGDDIDIDAAIENQIGVLAARDPDESFYLATARNRRDLSALILLDVSGSTAEPGMGRVAVHDHQRATVAALATTMHRLGDRVAVYAFSSHGRHNVRLTALKTFAEHSERPLLNRLDRVQPSGYSRLGAAIRHGATIIEQGGHTTRRLLVVVSDGLAFDHGYDLDHGARDVRRALAEARGRGTGCLCLTVGATGSGEDLRHVFGTAAHAAVPLPDQLASVIVRLTRTALRTADVRRRPH
ncbi:nitric oxide reductase activation protein NorD [Mycolicibacterium sp. HK-90]|uniref:nitric oxide reductase activation protein NorD n=1 Tax=Mycolicibacterium sp. HK-90 TaxID=3056937 RepID=UPI002659C4ED|nr:VWA domain-containing protein [Mycolicibacterium sp. HK-90]WKG05694.1 VWA domain-containing protein [Mycolicibacterium sp. HK-90]